MYQAFGDRIFTFIKVSLINKVLLLCKSPSWLIVCQKLIDLMVILNIQENLRIALIVASRKIQLKELDSDLEERSNFLIGCKEI